MLTKDDFIYVLVMIISFLAVGLLINIREDDKLISKCEEALPRNVQCQLVAVPITDKGNVK